jgi:hypothetical protein
VVTLKIVDTVLSFEHNDHFVNLALNDKRVLAIPEIMDVFVQETVRAFHEAGHMVDAGEIRALMREQEPG